MAIVPVAAHRRLAHAIVERLARELQLERIPRVDFVWRGTAAMTTDFLPHLYEFGPGFIGAIGCNGRGIAMTAMLGEVLADAASGVPLSELPVPTAPPARHPAAAACRRRRLRGAGAGALAGLAQRRQLERAAQAETHLAQERAG